MSNSGSYFKRNNSDNEFDLDAYLEEKSREGQTGKTSEAGNLTSAWSDTAKNSMLVVLTLVLSVLWYHDWNLGKLNDRFFGAPETAQFIIPPVPVPEPVEIHIPEPNVHNLVLAELQEKALIDRLRFSEQARNSRILANRDAIRNITQTRLQEKLEKLNTVGDLQIELGNLSEQIQQAMEVQNALRMEDIERLKIIQNESGSADQSQ